MDRALPILCENCGYDVDSLAARRSAEPGPKCPECATPMALSMPANRVGSPWQRHRSARSLLSTLRAVIFQPMHTFGRVRPEPGGWRLLLIVGLSTCILWPIMLTLFAAFGLQDQEGVLNRLTEPMFAWSVGWLAMCAIGFLLIRLRFRMHRWRLAPHATFQLLSHAMTPLLSGPIMCLPLTIVGLVVPYVPDDSLNIATRIAIFAFSFLLVLSVVAALLSVLVTPISVLIAVVVGTRAMRFANPPRETAP